MKHRVILSAQDIRNAIELYICRGLADHTAHSIEVGGVPPDLEVEVTLKQWEEKSRRPKQFTQ